LFDTFVPSQRAIAVDQHREIRRIGAIVTTARFEEFGGFIPSPESVRKASGKHVHFGDRAEIGDQRRNETARFAPTLSVVALEGAGQLRGGRCGPTLTDAADDGLLQCGIEILRRPFDALGLGALVGTALRTLAHRTEIDELLLLTDGRLVGLALLAVYAATDTGTNFCCAARSRGCGYVARLAVTARAIITTGTVITTGAIITLRIRATLAVTARAIITTRTVITARTIITLRVRATFTITTRAIITTGTIITLRKRATLTITTRAIITTGAIITLRVRTTLTITTRAIITTGRTITLGISPARTGRTSGTGTPLAAP
jgi:hypothetical protein